MALTIFRRALLLLLFVSQAFAMHVVIDPGHGGQDKGATRGQVHESAVTLKLAELLEQELKADGRFQVSLTRRNDKFLTLEDRASFANKNGDLFLSIHVNSSRDAKARGHEIYFQNQLPPDQESLFLASRENSQNQESAVLVRSVSFAIKSRPQLNPDVKAIVEDLERNHRLQLSGKFTEALYENWGGEHLRRKQPIRQAPFFVVSNIDKPSALVEIGYLSNDKEAEKLTNPEYQKKIAQGLYKAIVQFQASMTKKVDKASASGLN